MNSRLMQCISSVSLAFGFSIMLSQTALGDQSSSEGHGLEGSWMVTVTRINPPPGTSPTFLSLMTLTPDGQVLEESNTTAIRSLGHGEWVKIGPWQFQRTALNFRFAPPPAAPRTYIGVSRITAILELNRRGDEFTGKSMIESFDQDGNPVATMYSTEAGRLCDGSATIKRCLGTGD